MTEQPQQDSPPTGPGPDAVVLRPRVLVITAWVCAAVVMIFFVFVTLGMPSEPTGVYFRLADQIAMLVIGLFVAGGLLLMARPRARADRNGVEVRNILITRWFPWGEVVGVSFPDGASSARLELPDDEYHPVLAVQAVDRDLAVRGVRTLRDLHRAAVTGG